MMTTPDLAPRLHGLDALRGGALLMGIVLHAILPFEAGGQWMIADSTSLAFAGPATFVIHLFRMILFMALAGYFGNLVLRRCGSSGYLRDRLVRVLLPAIAFWPVSVLSTGILWELNIAWRDLPRPIRPGAEGGDPLLGVPVGVLWFLWTLIQCALTVVLARAVLNGVVGKERLHGAALRIGAWLTAPGGVLLAALPYLLGLLVQGTWNDGIVAPTTLKPELSSLVAYLGAFVVGWLLFAQRDSLRRLAEAWILHAVVAVVATASALTLDASSTTLLSGAALAAVAGWAWVYALLGVCVRFLHRERPLVRYLADASYWAYLLHLPIVLLVGIVVADLAWPAPIKLIVVLAITGAVLLASYHLLVRSSFLGRWLNRRRYAFRLGFSAPVVGVARGPFASSIPAAWRESPDDRELPQPREPGVA